MPEKNLRSVTFEFEDGSKKVLEGGELAQWEMLCSEKSDYLLPGDTDHVLAQAFHGLVRGFVPLSALRIRKREEQEWKKM